MNRFKTIVEIESQKEYYQKLHQVEGDVYGRFAGHDLPGREPQGGAPRAT